jgi:hypothetical protein
MTIRSFIVLALLGCSSSSAPDWSRKDAHRQCAAAIAAFPDTPAPSCAALRMCANEATLDRESGDELLAMMQAQACEPP